MPGALLDHHQPLVVAQVLADLAGLRQQLGGGAIDLGEQRIEHARLDCGVVAQRSEDLLLPLELLQDVGLEIGARGDVGDLEQRQQRRVVVLLAAAGREILDPSIDVLEPHHRAYALVQRMFVADHFRDRWWAAVGRRQRNDGPAKGERMEAMPPFDRRQGRLPSSQSVILPQVEARFKGSACVAGRRPDEAGPIADTRRASAGPLKARSAGLGSW